MIHAGVREARQNLSALLEEVRKGGEVLLTDRGKPVARLVPPIARAAKPFRSHAKLRDSITVKGKPVSAIVIEEREDRL